MNYDWSRAIESKVKFILCDVKSLIHKTKHNLSLILVAKHEKKLHISFNRRKNIMTFTIKATTSWKETIVVVICYRTFYIILLMSYRHVFDY